MILIWNYGALAQLHEGMGVWNWSGSPAAVAPTFAGVVGAFNVGIKRSMATNVTVI